MILCSVTNPQYLDVGKQEDDLAFGPNGDPTDPQFTDTAKQEDTIELEAGRTVKVIDYVWFNDQLVEQIPNPTFVAAWP